MEVTVTYFPSGNFATDQQIPIMINFLLEVDFFMHKSLKEDNSNLHQFFKYTKKHLESRLKSLLWGETSMHTTSSWQSLLREWRLIFLLW